MIKILLATMISLSSIGFTHEASEEWNDELREAIQANENEVVDHYNEDKIMSTLTKSTQRHKEFTST